MSTAVNIHFGALPDGWCPSSPQDFVGMLNQIVSAGTADTNAPVAIQFGVFTPGFCEPTASEFIAALSSVTSGYVMETGAEVTVTFADPGETEFCWSDPESIVQYLRGNYTATFET